MVKNAAAMQRKFRNAPPIIHERLSRGMERIAEDVVAQMAAINPLPGDIIIDWTWGSAPPGAVTLGKVGRTEQDKIAVTIFATAVTSEYPGGFPAVARWWEFGTGPRFHSSGKYVGQIPAQPYFWPTYRANKRSIRSRLAGILRRAIKKANAL